VALAVLETEFALRGGHDGEQKLSVLTGRVDVLDHNGKHLSRLERGAFAFIPKSGLPRLLAHRQTKQQLDPAWQKISGVPIGK
jgi:hypothetical protein